MLLKTSEDFHRLFPPRATQALNPAQLGRAKGFLAQYKYNDIRTLVHIHPGGELELLTRKRAPHLEYRVTPSMSRAIASLKLDPEKYHLLDGGILRHLKVRGERPLILWDILVHDSHYLIGTSYRSRYTLLRRVCGEPAAPEFVEGRKLGLLVRGPLWLAPVFTEDLAGLFRSTIEPDYLEGLLLKAPGAKLELGFREENNMGWQLKVRKPHTSYSY